MSYESLERELARRQSKRQSRRSKGDKKAKRKYSPYRRGGRKGSKTRTRLAEGEDKLGKALAAARERAAKYAKPRLNITKLPDREQLSLKDFEERSAEIFRAEMDCPPATQDVAINTKNRNATIKNFDYGPLNVEEPGDYWKDIAKRWNTTEKAAKKSNCGNCVAFDRSPRMKACMPGETSDGEGVLGYCWMHHFKCHSARTCDTWAKGGPITTDKVSEGWQERAFGGSKASKAAKKGRKETAKAAESKDEALVVEGYKPKRVEAWLSAGNAVIFYVGDRAELRYNHPMSMYQERTLLPSPLQPRQSGQSIINPTGITLADVDELMQVSTGEPWNGKYVLYTDEGNFLFYEPKNFMAETIIPDDVRENIREKAMDNVLRRRRQRKGVFRHPRHIREIKDAETKQPRKRLGITPLGKQPSLTLKNIRKYNRQPSLRAESFDLSETQQRILKYLSQIHPDRIHNWDPPKGLTQRDIAEAVGVVRTNATKHLNDLIDLGLVKMAKKRPVGERRLQKVYFPTFSGRRVGNSFASESMLLDLDGDGVIEPWEIETQEAMLTGLNHETIQPVEFEAMEKGLGDNLRQAAIEVLQDRTGWIGLDELTRLAAQKMYERKRGRKKSPRSLKGILSRAIGSSRGGIPPFYVTRDGRIYYYGDQDRGEFIKGVI